MLDGRGRARSRARLRPRAQGGAVGSQRAGRRYPPREIAFRALARSNQAPQSAGTCPGSKGDQVGWRRVAPSLNLKFEVRKASCLSPLCDLP